MKNIVFAARAEKKFNNTEVSLRAVSINGNTLTYTPSNDRHVMIYGDQYGNPSEFDVAAMQAEALIKAHDGPIIMDWNGEKINVPREDNARIDILIALAKSYRFYKNQEGIPDISEIDSTSIKNVLLEYNQENLDTPDPYFLALSLAFIRVAKHEMTQGNKLDENLIHSIRSRIGIEVPNEDNFIHLLEKIWSRGVLVKSFVQKQYQAPAPSRND